MPHFSNERPKGLATGAQERGKQVRKKCVVCDKGFRTRDNPKRVAQRIYCSKECKEQAKKRRRDEANKRARTKVLEQSEA